ncbi:MAG TPA: hypothetical protein VFP72_19200 [Kineosporiaceae bacterium]|nr:hypothetical protein [Kineosporiaceae bacterium]
MSVYLVLDWLVPQGHEAQTEAALTELRNHILSKHPQIRSVRVIREIADDPDRRGFRWEERYDTLEDSRSVELTDVCDDLWLQVWQVAVPGSHRQSLWDDGDRADWLES